MYGIVRLLPGGQVAAGVPAIGRCDRQSIVVVDVAGSAGHVGVAIGQQESCCAVVERRCIPTDRRMARGAVRCGKLGTRRGVHGVIRLLPGGQVAAGVTAIGRRDRQVVVVVDVARNAGHVGMAIGEQKTGRAVVKSCRRPTDRGMARGAVRKCKSGSGRRVYRIVRLLPVG